MTAEKQQPSLSGTLALLRVAALGLPGLVSQTAMADQDANWVTANSASVSIQAGAGYTPTGASRLLGQLGKEPTSSKQYRVKCYDDGSGTPSRLRLRVQGMASSAKFLVSATIERNGVVETVIDPTNGDQLYGQYAALSEGEGDYILTVSKVKKKDSAPDASLDGAMTFQTAQECNTATGAYTGISKPELTGSDTSPTEPPVNPPGTVSSSKLKTYSGSLTKKVDSKTFHVNCAANKAGQSTARYQFQIKAANKNLPFNLRMTVKEDGEEVTVLDPISGDKIFSDLASLDGDNGHYEIIVAKDSDTGITNKAVSFAIKHVCETATATQGKLTVSKK